MKHEWMWDEENDLKVCMNCGYLWGEEVYRKCGEQHGN